MRTTIFISLLGLGLMSFAATETASFQNLLKGDLNRKNVSQKVAATLKEMQAAYDKAAPEEREQIAADMELLTPLKELASSKMTSEDCEDSRIGNAVNFLPADLNDHGQKIEKAIDSICK